MGITVSGGDAVRAKLSQLPAHVRARLSQAVTEEADQVTADARANVRVLSGDLQQSIAPRVDGLSAEIRPRSDRSSESEKDHAIKAAANEFGRSSDPGQPYMVPASEQSRARWPKRAAEAVKEGVDE